MKYTLTLGLTALFTCTAFAAFNAPLPEFKNEKELAQWRAENASKPCKSSATEEPAFFTGKPYLESTGSYAFKYRNYNPEIARWTSEDPSGFPDGANGSAYAPNPTTEIDYAGLLVLNVTGSNLGSLGTWAQNALGQLQSGIEKPITIPGTQWRNPSNAPANAEISYSLNGQFTVNATILGTGVNGNATGGTAGTFQVAPGWGIRLIAVWKVGVNGGLGYINHVEWRPEYFE